MAVAMTLPTMVPHDRGDTLAWCRAIDTGPWSSLAVPERITFPSHALVVELAAAAALTERVRLWTTILVLPAHDEVEVAKQMASVDRLSDGRLTLGVGVGGRDHDYRAIGGNFAWTPRSRACAASGRASPRSPAPIRSVPRRCRRAGPR